MQKGFIDKNQILKYVSEEDIYELVFGFKPQVSTKVLSPLRIDKNPDCYFEYYNGRLYFKDFSYYRSSVDCFTVVKDFYSFSNFYETLFFIKERLINNKKLKPLDKKIIIPRKEIKLLIKTKDFNENDKNYWEKYGISKKNLIEDKVFSLSKYKIINRNKRDLIYNVEKSLCYAYTDFKNDRKKIYKPNNKFKFISNCKADDIGGIKTKNEGTLFISKSYKDYRVLKNEELNVIWFQSETLFPSLDVLKKTIKGHDKIIIFFDNDKTGIEKSLELKEIINNISPFLSENIFLPVNLLKEKIKDPSDLIEKKGKKELRNFLKNEFRKNK